MPNEVYGFDAAHNKHEVPTIDQLNLLAVEVGTKQEAFDITEGAVLSDCNTAVSTGCYYVTSVTSNTPEQSNFFLMTYSMNTEHSIVMQQLYRMDGQCYYIRFYNNGSWTLWRKYQCLLD